MSKSTELKYTTQIVRYLLETCKATRNSDTFLYYKVLEHISRQKGIALKRMPVDEFFHFRKDYGFPFFESVRRARQKIQATYPDLRACDEVEQHREDNEVAVRDYARGAV